MENKKVHYKMYKSGKTWVIAGIFTVSLGLSIWNSNVLASAHTDGETNVSVSDKSQNNVSTTESENQTSDNQNNVSTTGNENPSSPDQNNSSTTSDQKDTENNSSQSIDSNAAKSDKTTDGSNSSSIAKSNPNDPKYDFNYAPTFNEQFNQNYHYNNPQGFSNDIQSIVPKYDENGKVQYWEVYYLGTQYPNNNNYTSHWYGLKTTDFIHFSPLSNPTNPTSKDNVAIPDAYYKDENGNSFEVADNNKNGIPWDYVATGAIVSNDAINNKPLLTTDQWGNSIDSDAELAYFSTFENAGGQGGIYLAYKNKNSQFHPYNSKAIVSKEIVGTQPSTDFRDPYITTNGKQLIMYVAGGLNHKMFTLTSNDGINWNHNPNDDVQLDSLVETPSIQTISGQTMMFYSAQPSVSNKQGFTKYVTGHLDSNGIFKRTGEIKNLDDGSDFYAGNYVKIDNDTVANIGWLGDWIYTPSIWSEATFPGNLHAGSFTMPRVLQYDGNQVTTIPIEPGQAKLESKTRVKSTQNVVKVPSSKKVEIDYDAGTDKNIYLVRNAHNSITISIANNKMTVARKEDRNVVGGMNLTTSTDLNGVKIKRVVIYVDNSSVEIYLPQIKKMFTLEDLPNEKSNQSYSLKTDKSAKVNIYSLSGSVDSNYVNGLYSSIQNRLNKMKTRFGSEYSQISSVSYAKKALNNAMSYINKANKLNGDVTANIYLSIANYYLSTANYWNDVSGDLKVDAGSVADRYVARLGQAKTSYNKAIKELNIAKHKLNKKHSRANINAYKKALSVYNSSKKNYSMIVDVIYKKAPGALKDTKHKAAIAKRAIKADNKQLNKLRKTMRKHHSKKQAKKLASQYKKLLKKVKAGQRYYSKLVNKEKLIVKFTRSLSTINRDDKYLSTAKSKAAKAKATVKKHNSKKNKSAFIKLSNRVISLTKSIKNAEKFISKNSTIFR